MAETPDSSRKVVAWVQPKNSAARFPVLARYYAEPFEESPAGDHDYDWLEYDEESDTYSCPAGWYEEAAAYGDDCAPCVRIPDADVAGWCEVPRLERGDG